MPRHGGDAQPRRRRRLGQLAEQVEDVGLVAGAVTAEHVGVDDDERVAHASSRQSASRRSAACDQVNATGALEAERPQLVAPRFGLDDTRGDRIRVERVDEHGRAARHLLRGAASRRHDRRPARHRLDHRQPEALVEGREHEAPRAAVERCELLVVDASRPSREPRPHPSPARRRPAARRPPAALPRPRGRGSCAARACRRRARSLPAAFGPVSREHGLEPVGDDANPLGGNVEQLDELVSRERRNGDDRVGAPGAVAKRDAARVPVPEREGIGVPEQGAVVDSDDHGKLRAQRPAHRRAMEHVRRPRLVRDAERVPRKVADDGRRAPVTVEADRQELELRPALERAREALHDAGRAGARLGERGDVERDLHRAAS